MLIDRRALLSTGAAAAALTPFGLFAQQEAAQALTSMTGDIVPIARAEYQARIEKARRLMAQHGLGAILIEPGASLTYFTGVRWWRSERLTAVVIPREGEAVIVTPHFEEPSVRESLKIAADIRVWNEHEDPLAVVAGILRDRRVTAPVGIEETVRFFAVDGLQARHAPRRDPSRQPGRARLPDDQVRDRARADAEGDGHHHRRLSLHLAPDRARHESGPDRRDHERRDHARSAAIPNSLWSCSARPAPIRTARASRSRSATARWC